MSEGIRTQKKRGRPANSNSEDTRARLVESARRHFAQHGFDGATMGDIARGADIVPSAVYRYFPDKETLYEAVFEATISRLWDSLDAATRDHESAGSALRALFVAADRATTGFPYYPEFLRGLPLEVERHPQFRRLLARRTEVQRKTFRHMTMLGRSTGEFDDSLDDDELSEHIRVIVMGWLVERHLHPEEQRLSPSGLVHILRLR